MPRGAASVVLIEDAVASSEVCSALSRSTPCTRAYAAAELGSASKVLELISTGSLRELPPYCTPDDFRRLFSDISIVSPTGIAVRVHDHSTVHLACPEGESVRVSVELYEVLRRSAAATVSLPDVIDAVAEKWGRADSIMIEVIDKLRALIVSGAVVLVPTKTVSSKTGSATSSAAHARTAERTPVMVSSG